MLSESCVLRNEVREPSRSIPTHATMRQPRCYYVYILGSLSGTLYIGVTGKLEKRLRQHKEHVFEGFSEKYDVDRLLYWESYDDVHMAIAREKQLKGWRREKKIGLIESANPHWVDLSREWYESVLNRAFSAPLNKATPPERRKCHSRRSEESLPGKLS